MCVSLPLLHKRMLVVSSAQLAPLDVSNQARVAGQRREGAPFAAKSWPGRGQKWALWGPFRGGEAAQGCHARCRVRFPHSMGSTI